MDLEKEDYIMFNDFYYMIKEDILEFKINPTAHIIKSLMTRIDQETVELYKEYGMNDTVFRDSLYVLVKRFLENRGYLSMNVDFD